MQTVRCISLSSFHHCFPVWSLFFQHCQYCYLPWTIRSSTLKVIFKNNWHIIAIDIALIYITGNSIGVPFSTHHCQKFLFSQRWDRISLLYLYIDLLFNEVKLFLYVSWSPVYIWKNIYCIYDQILLVFFVFEFCEVSILEGNRLLQIRYADTFFPSIIYLLLMISMMGSLHIQ